MGLDYWAYIKRNNERPWEFSEEDKLAYGRKCWELVYMFGTPTDGDCCGPLDRDAYFRFIKAVEDFGADKIRKYKELSIEIDDNYLEFQDAFDSESGMNEDVRNELNKKYEEYIKLEEEYTEWWDKTFDNVYEHLSGPYLGYDFSTGYILDFYEARHKITAAWLDGDEVWCCAWY